MVSALTLTRIFSVLINVLPKRCTQLQGRGGRKSRVAWECSRLGWRQIGDRQSKHQPVAAAGLAEPRDEITLENLEQLLQGLERTGDDVVVAVVEGVEEKGQQVAGRLLVQQLPLRRNGAQCPLVRDQRPPHRQQTAEQGYRGGGGGEGGGIFNGGGEEGDTNQKYCRLRERGGAQAQRRC